MALHDAIRSGNVPILKDLIASGIDVNERDSDGYTALNIACGCSNEDMVRVLLEQGADPNISNNLNSAPLYDCVCGTININIVRLLLDHKANVNAQHRDNNTALHIAIIDTKLSNIEILLQYGANPNIINRVGRVPLYYAVTTNDLAKVRLLLRYGADYHLLPKNIDLSDEIRTLFEQYACFDIKEPDV
jgi:ankyrin repeat protein